MTDMDYSKTRIFERHTNLETTNKKNAELKEMYQTFYNEMYQAFNIKKKVKFEMKKYNGIQLLTCFDSYLNADNKIIIKNSIFRNSLIFQGLPPIKYQNLMYFPLFLPL